MLLQATLCLPNAGRDQYIGIPVVHFPVLPVGSGIVLHISGEVIDDAIIQSYEVSNHRGTDIVITYKEDMDEETLTDIWNTIAEVCGKDLGGTCDLLYPNVIDFGVPHPRPPT